MCIRDRCQVSLTERGLGVNLQFLIIGHFQISRTGVRRTMQGMIVIYTADSLESLVRIRVLTEETEILE